MEKLLRINFELNEYHWWEIKLNIFLRYLVYLDKKKYDVFLFKQRSYVTKFWMFSDVTDILSLRIDFYK